MGDLSRALPRRPHRGDDRLSRLERALLWVHGGMLVCFAAVSVGPLLETASPSLAQVLPRVTILATYLLVAIDLQVRGERREHIVVLLVPLVAVGALQTAPIASDVASGLTIGAIALSAARQLTPWGYLSVMLPAGAFHVASRTMLGGDFGDAVSDVVVGVGTAYAVYAFAEALRSAAERAVAADAETARQRHAAAREDAQRRAVAAAGQALHDEVLVALRAVGDAAQSTLRVREVCSRAVQAVAEIETQIPDEVEVDTGPGARASRARSERTVLDLVAAIVDASPVAVTPSVAEADGTVTMSRSVFGAVRRAAGEALRNVERHSGAVSAGLGVEAHPDGLRVRIVDRGSGRPEDSSEGFGTSGSIRGPLAAVGGSVEFRATPGGGTTVELRAPLQSSPARSRLARAYELTVRATGSARPINSITWPVTLIWIYTALRYSFEWPRPVVSLGLAVVFTAVTALVVLRITHRRPSASWVAGVATVLVGLDAVSLALAPDGSLLDYRSWTIGFLAAPLVALTMILPTPVALVVLVPHPLLILAAAQVNPSLTSGAVPWGSVNAVLATPVAAIFLGRLLRHIGRHVESEERTAARLAAQRAHRRSMAAVRSVHLDHTRRWILPWLTAIGEGRVDPAAAGASQKAALLAAEVRDDLYAPGFLHGETRRRVTAFREAGGKVTLRPGFAPGDPGHAVVGVLNHLLDVVSHHHRITITPQASGDEQSRVRFAVVPPTAGPVAPDLDGHEIDIDGYRTVITVAGDGATTPRLPA